MYKVIVVGTDGSDRARVAANEAIAEELVITPATAARHVANIMSKLGFNSRAQIAAWVLTQQNAGQGDSE